MRSWCASWERFHPQRIHLLNRRRPRIGAEMTTRHIARFACQILTNADEMKRVVVLPRCFPNQFTGYAEWMRVLKNPRLIELLVAIPA